MPRFQQRMMGKLWKQLLERWQAAAPWKEVIQQDKACSQTKRPLVERQLAK